ncbi:MAG: hypothetical protein ABW088_14135 [Sedimenticola sp.]
MSSEGGSSLREEIEKAFEVVKERNSQQYDGVLGTLPGWVPEWAKVQFHSYRNRLLDIRGYSPDELRKWITRYSNAFLREGVEHQPLMYPTNYPNGQPIDDYCFENEIGFLSWLECCVRMGEVKGLERLGGGFAALGIQRQKQQIKFAKAHGEELSEERRKEWERWNCEAERLIKTNPHLGRKGGKSELARRIKDNLQLSDSERTIRRRLK